MKRLKLQRATRHLTRAEKAAEVAWMRAAYKEAWRTDVGGQGYMDLAMIPYLEQINDIEGVCTVQSCAGHVYSEERDRRGRLVERHADQGLLWLRLSKSAAAKFARRVEELTSQNGIEMVSIRYHHQGYTRAREVHSIQFRGQEDGRLHESMTAIVSFLKRVGGAW